MLEVDYRRQPVCPYKSWIARNKDGSKINITDAQKVVTRYQSEVDGLQKLIKSVKSSLAMALTAITLGLTFLVFWLGVLQVQVLLKGLELLRGDHH